jgi:hypothetical protein
MIVIAAVFCLMIALLAGGLLLLECALRLLPWGLGAVALALEAVLRLASAAISASRIVRRSSPWGALPAK